MEVLSKTMPSRLAVPVSWPEAESGMHRQAVTARIAASFFPVSGSENQRINDDRLICLTLNFDLYQGPLYTPIALENVHAQKMKIPKGFGARRRSPPNVEELRAV